jgi:DNA-binding helix-hairpin-helix protein with protein kinase domain
VIGGLLVYQAGGFIAGLIFAFLLWPRINETKLAAASERLRGATAKTRTLWNEWDRQSKSHAFNDRRRELEKLAWALRHLPTERNQALQSLEERKRELQLSKYLDKFDIAKANVPLIGPSRAAMLASHGIETAADVETHRIESIAGFGPRMAANLIEWRRGLQQRFRFDPTQPTDPREIAEVERKIFEKRVKLVQELERGPIELRRIAAEITEARRRLLPALESALREENEAHKAVEAL